MFTSCKQYNLFPKPRSRQCSIYPYLKISLGTWVLTLAKQAFTEVRGSCLGKYCCADGLVTKRFPLLEKSSKLVSFHYIQPLSYCVGYFRKLKPLHGSNDSDAVDLQVWEQKGCSYFTRQNQIGRYQKPPDARSQNL